MKDAPRSPSRAATRERLLEAACALFAERGWHGTRVQDVCRAADANPLYVVYRRERLVERVARVERADRFVVFDKDARCEGEYLG